MRTILVVDDEKNIVDIVAAYLKKDGFQTLIAHDGREAIEIIKKERPDLIVLDLMLPEISGWNVCKMIRRESDVPIIMLTAREDVTDRIVGLEIGADDYLIKPFDPKELIARIKAVLRRRRIVEPTSKILNIKDLSLDIDKRILRRSETLIDLTPIEFEILKIMISSPGQVFSRIQLLNAIQNDAFEGYERTIDSHVKNIRHKIEPKPNKPRYILTVHGVGYKASETGDV